ncbi:transcription elongation factor SPT5-like [Gigantopelta aegis]|uniref:transcription elongation factor SPT5-like n=1 Tax=Gigantopelta aegis TaxID=1735272 RepID=UPI001B88BBA4|nr:transcription elongation factor SPT5-like [Gigantopelta aegis]XP_041365561.1 transcription elongation factor SPT5-like [Gigantopelta aegis]XP_041365562.1 transcription elongation factor SPT5-like [Gigantopelta aegis]XP_041365563.1 transcription elongation factor SPT5-like [Gigantopelta aegis]XP_041365564.1 transcription elongation factor SPT5-like [Gigantopelta aegis]
MSDSEDSNLSGAESEDGNLNENKGSDGSDGEAHDNGGGGSDAAPDSDAGHDSDAGGSDAARSDGGHNSDAESVKGSGSEHRSERGSEHGSERGSDVGSDSEGSDVEEVKRKRRRHQKSDEEDPAENYFDEDEDDEAEKRRRLKRARVSKFIIEEADVDEDDEDEDDVEWEEGAEDIIDRKSQYEGNSVREIESHQRLRQMWDSQREDEIEEYYRNKYSEKSVAERYGEGEEMSDEITQQGLLPGVKDPNLWVVKCRIGEEKPTVIHLMRKLITYQFTDEPLQIKCAIAKEGLKGYIYIEAYKQTHVKQAIDGIGNLRIGCYQQQMVPIKEMTDVLKVIKETANLKPKSWVRLKRGIFKDDLAQVDYVEPAQNVVHLKLLPRVDYSKMRGVLKNSAKEDADKKKRFRKPPTKLFDVDAVRAIGGEVSTDGDFLIFEGNRYSRKGFLFKSFAMSAIVAEGVKPTLTELERFEDQPDSMDVELVQESKSAGEISHNFAPGDVVEVCEGELIHLQGKIIRCDGNKITIMPKHEDLKDPLEFPSHELRKYFKMGDHVKVCGGRYEGDTGLIVRVEDAMVVLFSDLTMHELKVLPKHLQLCTDMATGVDSLGQYQFGDLVQLDPQTVGCIVRLEKENFQVLNMHNKVMSLKPQAIMRKRDTKHAVALDSENNNLQVRDIVKVIDGPHSGRQGEIKHLYRSHAFLMSRLMTENGGYFVCRARHLVLAGGSRQSTTTVVNGFMSPRLSSPAHPSGGGSTPGAGRGRGGMAGGKRDRDLIGQTVRIIQGPFKGYIGIVKDSTEATARVELHSSCKTISVDRTRLATLTGGRTGGYSSSYAKTPTYGGQTPMHGSRTPMYGSQTPLHDGSRTPHYGSQTPSHEPGSRTPSGGGSAWDPANPNTPARQNEYDYTFDSTPSPADYASTPNPSSSNYQADTPSPMGPYTPQTPGSGYSPYHASPSPSGYQAQSPGYSGTPSPTPFQQSPSPSGFAGTPSPIGYSPMTPGAPFTPQTPGAAMSADHGLTDWHTTDIEVRIKQSHEDHNLIFHTGVVKSITGGMCSVFLHEQDKVVNVSCEHLEPVEPEKGNRAKVILGDDRELTGTLLSIDTLDGVFKAEDGEIKMLPIKYLCKMPEPK